MKAATGKGSVTARDDPGASRVQRPFWLQTNGAALFAVKHGSLACAQLVAQYGQWVSRLLYFAAVPTFRFSEGFSGPHESTTDRLSRSGHFSGS